MPANVTIHGWRGGFRCRTCALPKGMGCQWHTMDARDFWADPSSNHRQGFISLHFVGSNKHHNSVGAPIWERLLWQWDGPH